MVLGLHFFPQQWRAVTAPVGPVLVLAGPGAGKTRCLTGRIAHLLLQGVVPGKICAITFTNKAAEEIAGRLHERLGDLAEQLTLGTIHALCLDLLRAHGRRVGLPGNFGIADEAHQRLVLSRFGVHTKRHGQMLLLFGRKRLQGYTLSAQDDVLFTRYQRELRSNHLIDYDEILALTLALLESNDALLTGIQARWEHVLVDEFQDLDLTQYRILQLLAQGHRNLFAVGDDEQSIFSWRGADPHVMARFVRDFSIAEPIVLDVNCRCSKAIFEAARKILPPGELPFTKEITAVRESAHPVRAVQHCDDDEETRWLVADLQKELTASGARHGEFAVLYRTHQMGQQAEEALVAAGIACQLARGQALADDPVIAQVLGALRIILYPDADLHVEHLAQKVLSEPALVEVRGMPGQSLLDRLRAYAQQKAGPDSARCWRFLYQVENLMGLKQGADTLADLMQAILAQGIGQYETVLDRCHEQLADPQSLPWAVALSDVLLRTAEKGGTVYLAPADGLEIPIKVMLERTLPELHVEYRPATSQVGERDLVLALDALAVPPDRLRVTPIFKALQLMESRHYRPLFTDYVVFDTETSGKEADLCEVIELAAVKVRSGAIVDKFHSLVRANRPIAPGATAVHGYRDADLIGAPPLEAVWPNFRRFAGDDVLVS